MPTVRSDQRQPDQLRPLTIEANIAPHASGSVLLGFGAGIVHHIAFCVEDEPHQRAWRDHLIARPSDSSTEEMTS